MFLENKQRDWDLFNSFSPIHFCFWIYFFRLIQEILSFSFFSPYISDIEFTKENQIYKR